LDNLLGPDIDDLDGEEFLLSENDLMNQAEFMVTHRAALDRLKSIRLSSRLSISSAARLSMRVRNSIKRPDAKASLSASPALTAMMK